MKQLFSDSRKKASRADRLRILKQSNAVLPLKLNTKNSDFWLRLAEHWYSPQFEAVCKDIFADAICLIKTGEIDL